MVKEWIIQARRKLRNSLLKKATEAKTIRDLELGAINIMLHRGRYAEMKKEQMDTKIYEITSMNRNFKKAKRLVIELMAEWLEKTVK